MWLLIQTDHELRILIYSIYSIVQKIIAVVRDVTFLRWITKTFCSSLESETFSLFTSISHNRKFDCPEAPYTLHKGLHGYILKQPSGRCKENGLTFLIFNEEEKWGSLAKVWLWLLLHYPGLSLKNTSLQWQQINKRRRMIQQVCPKHILPPQGWPHLNKIIFKRKRV